MSNPNARTLSHRQAKQLATLLSNDSTPNSPSSSAIEAQFTFNSPATSHAAAASLSRKSLSKLGSMAKAMSSKTSALFNRKKLPEIWEPERASTTEQPRVPSIILTDASLTMYQEDWISPVIETPTQERRSISSIVPPSEDGSSTMSSSGILTPVRLDIPNPLDNVAQARNTGSLGDSSKDDALHEASLDTLDTQEVQRILSMKQMTQHTINYEPTIIDNGGLTASVHFQPTIDTIRHITGQSHE